MARFLPYALLVPFGYCVALIPSSLNEASPYNTGVFILIASAIVWISFLGTVLARKNRSRYYMLFGALTVAALFARSIFRYMYLKASAISTGLYSCLWLAFLVVIFIFKPTK